MIIPGRASRGHEAAQTGNRARLGGAPSTFVIALFLFVIVASDRLARTRSSLEVQKQKGMRTEVSIPLIQHRLIYATQTFVGTIKAPDTDA